MERRSFQLKSQLMQLGRESLKKIMQTCRDFQYRYLDDTGAALLLLSLQSFVSVASERVHVGKRHVLIGCKRDMFWRQTFEVWSRQVLST